MKMTISPKKHASNFTNCTTNRGVEAKELEIANIDMYASSSIQLPVESSNGSLTDQVHTEGLTMGFPPQIHSSSAADETASYVQVVVQKHHRKREASVTAAAQTSPRLPTSSSPIAKQMQDNEKSRGAGAVYMVGAHPVFFACPPLHAAQYLHSVNTDDGHAVPCDSSGAGDTHKRPPQPAARKSDKTSLWKKISNIASEERYSCDNGPDRVEVYYFERGAGEFLAARDGTHGSAALERAAARCERACARAGSELLAALLTAPRLAFAAALAMLLHFERCALVAARGVLAGGVQTASDAALKPVLALVFNAMVLPPLVFVGNVSRAVRDALRPVALALGDAMEPLARLAGAVRLVHVERSCGCGRAHVV